MARRRPERIEFPNGRGDRLAARLDLPLGPARATALFAHCFTCGKDIAAASRVSRKLTEAGLAVLRFDFTGLGHSEGEFANTSFASNVDDLVAAAAWLRDEREAPSLLVGHSLGGTAVIAAAPRLPEVRAVATIGAPADPGHVRGLLREQADVIEREGEAEVEIAGRTFRIRREFLEDLRAQSLEATLGSLGRALLVMHAPGDAVVGIDHASRIFLAAKHPKSFVSLDDADHLLSRRRDAEYAAATLAAWTDRYLPERVTPMPAPGDLVVVEESPEEAPYGNLIQAGPHSLRADEPPFVGGLDTGPTPYGLLLAGLGSCTSITLRMYANRKQLPLDHARVTLHHEKINAKDCETCETVEGKVDRIDRTIELEGDLDPEQRARLLEIADRCPVHRTLESEVSIVTELRPATGDRVPE